MSATTAVISDLDQLRMAGSKPGLVGAPPRTYAAGRICGAEGCGRVVISTEGRRAQLARPLALLWSAESRDDAQIAWVRDRYPVGVCRQLPALVEEWGPGKVERDLSAA